MKHSNHALIITLTALLSLGCLYFIIYGVTLYPFEPFDLAKARDEVVAPAIADNRIDSTSYLLGILFLPSFLMGIGYLLFKILNEVEIPKMLQGGFWLLLLWILIISPFNLLQGGFQKVLWPETLLAGVVIFALYSRLKVSGNYLMILPVFFAAIVGYSLYFFEFRLPKTYHFEPVFYSFSQLMSGKTLLSGNLIPSYGLYNALLWPFLAFLEPSVSNYSAVMAFSMFASMLAVICFLFSAISNNAIATAGSLIYLSLIPLVFLRQDISRFIEPYYQYTPIRVLFPSLMIYLVWRYLEKDSKSRFWQTSLLSSVAILWNLETGIICFVSFGALLVFDRFFFRPCANSIMFKRLGLHLLSLLLVFLGYSLYSRAIFGAFPEFSKIFFFPKIFINTGYFMLPAPLVGSWTFLVFLILVGLAKGAIAILNKSVEIIDVMVVYLAILSIGLLSYYVGRSHPFNLTGGWYPVVLLVTLLYSQSHQKQRRPILAQPFVILFFVFASYGLTTMTLYTKKTLNWQKSQSRPLKVNYFAETVKTLQAIQARYPDQEILVLSLLAGSLHYQSGVPIPKVWDFPAFQEILTKAQASKQRAVIDEMTIPLIFVSGKPAGYKLAVEKSYQPLEYTKRGILYERAPWLKNARTNNKNEVEPKFSDVIAGSDKDKSQINGLSFSTEPIQFSTAKQPFYLKEFVGMTKPKPWGRWLFKPNKKGKLPKLGFYFSLPQRFTLVLKIRPLVWNPAKEMAVKIGSQTLKVAIKPETFTVHIPVDLKGEKLYNIYFDIPFLSKKEMLAKKIKQKITMGLISASFEEYE
ncbi:MAG: hypothetical protein QNL04_05425 [SAR324 cluster bacterium]|nr:hypothetical protein [SAR324 cluster bacterium]